MADETEIETLREKVRSLDLELYQLRNLAKRAISDYDDLYGKYREAKKTNEDLVQKFNEQEIKFEQVVQVLQGAANDFAAMESKVHMGEYLQTEAEKFASKLYVENNKMKRQSQRLMEALGSTNTLVMDIDIDGVDSVSEIGSDSSMSTGQLDALNETIAQLRKTVETLESNLNNAQIERQTALGKAESYRLKYEAEKQRLAEARNSLGMYESVKENFARVSEAAANRIESLEKEVIFHKSLTEQAVLKANQLHKKHQTLKRQSLAVVHSTSNDESLNRALDQIQKLTLEMETQRAQYEEKLSSLSTESQNEEIVILQKDYATIQKENEVVSSQNADLLHKLETANHDIRVLREQLDQAKKGPPPPPPPPPPPIKVLNPIKWILGKGTKPTAEKSGPKKPEGAENFDKALEELMQRIKNKASQEPSAGIQRLIEGDQHQTSQQLNDFITSLKKTEVKPRARMEKEPEPELEFLAVRRKMSGKNLTALSEEPQEAEGNEEEAKTPSEEEAKTNGKEEQSEDEVELRR